MYENQPNQQLVIETELISQEQLKQLKEINRLKQLKNLENSNGNNEYQEL